MEKILRLPKVIEVTGRSKPTIYADIKKGLFPAPVKIGVRAVGWTSSSVQNWIAERIPAQHGSATC